MERLQKELLEALKRLENIENLHNDWKTKEASYVKTQCELISKTQALQAQNLELTQTLSQVQLDNESLKKSYDGCADKIAALRSVARALESENQLLASEKENLAKFKSQFCAGNTAFRYTICNQYCLKTKKKVFS